MLIYLVLEEEEEQKQEEVEKQIVVSIFTEKEVGYRNSEINSPRIGKLHEL